MDVPIHSRPALVDTEPVELHGQETPLGTHRVLLVDDERHITMVVGHRLRRLGLEVDTAHDGVDALELASSDPPHLIITDYQMPRMDGIELALALAEDARTSEIPLIMLTGRGHRLMSSVLARTNIVRLLGKPFSPGELVELVQQILDGDPENAADAA